jgi:hypothetical protein
VISVIIHINNEEPILCELDNLPTTTDTMLIVKNPRRRDGKDINYLDASVTTVIWPVTRVNFIEVLHSDEEDEKIISFVRET